MCGVEGSRPQPLAQASALKETESGEARAADLDLFDGVDEENEFHTIGIGDRQPKAYENLSCNDRMLLGVLKV